MRAHKLVMTHNGTCEKWKVRSRPCGPSTASGPDEETTLRNTVPEGTEEQNQEGK